MDLRTLSKKELQEQLYNEFLYYAEEPYDLCKIICNQISRRMVYRIISKLYRIRKTPQ